MPKASSLDRGRPRNAAFPQSRSTSVGIERELVREYLPAKSHANHDLLDALEQSGGNRSRAAQAVGLTLRQFNYRLAKFSERAGS